MLTSIPGRCIGILKNAPSGLRFQFNGPKQCAGFSNLFKNNTLKRRTKILLRTAPSTTIIKYRTKSVFHMRQERIFFVPAFDRCRQKKGILKRQKLNKKFVINTEKFEQQPWRSPHTFQDLPVV